MKNRILALTVLVALGTISANTNAVTATGTPACGTWIKDRGEGGWEAITDEDWLVGFLSGSAAALNKDFLLGTNADSLFLWTDNYCKANPLDSVGGAAINLEDELTQRKGL